MAPTVARANEGRALLHDVKVHYRVLVHKRVLNYFYTVVYLRAMSDMIDPRLLQTVHNFAAEYNGGKGVTPSYIYRLIRENKLPSITIDGTVFVLLSEPIAKK